MIGAFGVQVLTAYFAVNFEQAEGCLEGSRFEAYATDQATFALSLVWPKRVRATERLWGRQAAPEHHAALRCSISLSDGNAG